MDSVDFAEEPLPIDAAATVAEGWSRTLRDRARGLSLTDGPRILGEVDAGDLRRAVRYGLAELPLRGLLWAGPGRGRPARSASRVAPIRLRRWGAALDHRLGGEARRLLERIEEKARAGGIPVFLVGGIVRDVLAGRPTRDVDVLVDGDLAPVLDGLGVAIRGHGPFLTASLRTDDGVCIDLARARREHYARPAALPEVFPAPIQTDLARRDFTVNAMALRLVPRGVGKLLDPFGGFEDLKARRLRVLHPLSFVEDPTRVLRGVRLTERFALELDRPTARALELARASGALGRLRGSRLLAETERMLSGPRPQVAIGRLSQRKVLREMLPGLHASPAALAALERSARRGAPAGARRWVIALAILAGARPREQIEDLIERLGADRELRSVLRGASAAFDDLRGRLSTKQRLRRSDVFGICRAKPPELLLAATAFDADSRPLRRVARYLQCDRHASCDIDGRDLLAAGVPPGPGLARGLEAALAAKLDGRAPTPGEQLHVALRVARGRA